MTIATWHIEMQAACRALLIQTVDAQPLADRPEIAWEGERYTPTQAAFIQELFRPDTQRSTSVGRAAGTIEHRATFALTLLYPPGVGTLPARTMIGAIMQAFQPGTRLERGGCSAWVQSVDPRPAVQEPDRYTAPVLIGLIGHSNL